MVVRSRVLDVPSTAPEPGSAWPGVLTMIVATKDTDAAHDVVSALFAPSTTRGEDRERVVRVFRWKTYLADPPSTASLWDAIHAKVGTPPTTVVTSELQKREVWVFNPAGALVGSGSTALTPAGILSFVPWQKPVAPKMPTGATIEAYSASLADIMSRQIGERYRGGQRMAGMPSMPEVASPTGMKSAGPSSFQICIAPTTDNPLLARA